MISEEYRLIDHYLGGVPHEEHELGGYGISAKGKLRVAMGLVRFGFLALKPNHLFIIKIKPNRLRKI